MTLRFGALFCDSGVPLASFLESVDFGFGGVLAPEGLNKVGAFVGYGADGFGAAVIVDLGHGGLVDALHAAVDRKSVV